MIWSFIGLIHYIVEPYYVLLRLLNIFCVFYVLSCVISRTPDFVDLFHVLRMKVMLIAFCVSFVGMIPVGMLSMRRHFVACNILPGGNFGFAMEGLMKRKMV